MSGAVCKPPIGPRTQLCMSLAARPGHFGSRFHNRLYELLGLDFLYKAFTTTDLRGAIVGIRALGIRGCAISMPFKEEVIALLDDLHRSAATIDSVNTIVNEDGRLIGYNTDYSAVARLLDSAHIGVDVSFILNGSGGMAKAVAAALHDRGHRHGTIVSRNTGTGRALADRYEFDFESSLDGRHAPLIINATPVGMSGPDAGSLSFPDAVVAAANWVFEVVALPAETPLVMAAHRHGCATISGAEVAVLQALEQFVLYTGVHPTAEQVQTAAQFARSS